MNKIIYLLLFLIITFFAYGILTKKELSSIKKLKRVECQKKTITFEKISNKDSLEKAITLLLSNNYMIKSKIEQSTYMKSTILDYISKKEADKMLVNTIYRYLQNRKNRDTKLLIDYYILENDKEDKGKKSKKAKLYAGYLVFEFKFENKLVYKIQTDYMKIDTSDIPERLDCVIKSFISLKEK